MHVCVQCAPQECCPTPQGHTRCVRTLFTRDGACVVVYKHRSADDLLALRDPGLTQSGFHAPMHMMYHAASPPSPASRMRELQTFVEGMQIRGDLLTQLMNLGCAEVEDVLSLAESDINELNINAVERRRLQRHVEEEKARREAAKAMSATAAQNVCVL